MISVRRWDKELEGPLTEKRVRESISQPWKYRVRLDRYPVGARRHGSMRASTCYVLGGAGHFEFATEAVDLRAGDVALLPEGTYWLTVGQEEELSVVFTWELPPAFAGFG